MSQKDTRKLSSRHQKTLSAVFEHPTRADIRWDDVEHLFSALGAQQSEGRGSRVRIILGDVRAVFHRPHSSQTAGKGTVRAVRRLLLEAGIDPRESHRA